MIIDFATHILPPAYYQALLRTAPPGFPLERRIATLPGLTSLEARFRGLQPFAGRGYRQVLSVASPPAESVSAPAQTAELYRILNEELAALVDRHPDHFVAALGNIPLNDPDAALSELDRVAALGLPGVQVWSNVDGMPLDHPRILPVVEEVARRGLAMFLHPARTPVQADYPGETRSRYNVWQAFGWPYDTTVAMVRLVFSGLFDRVPGARIVTHHLGAMVPYFAGRVPGGQQQMEAKDPDPQGSAGAAPLRLAPSAYMRMFYGDTAVSGQADPMRCGIAFFGAEHVVFGSDTPFDWSDGGPKVAGALAAIDSLDLEPAARSAIMESNTRSLLGLAAR